MPMSKRKTIYKPKKGKRISRKKLYRLPKKMKLHGGGILEDFKKFLTGGEVPDLSGGTDHLNDSNKDSESMDVSPEEPSNESMDVSPEEPSNESMDVSPVEPSNESMDVSPEEQSNESMDVSPEVDSKENSSNLATKVSEFGTLVGDSAKNVFNEGIETMTRPSDVVDENISTDVANISDTNDVEELKKQIVILKDENNELKTKLIDKLEKENDTLKQGANDYQSDVSPSLEENTLNNELDENTSMNVLPDQESNSMDISPNLDETTQESTTMQYENEDQPTIDLDSTPPNQTETEPSPDFGEVSTIEQEQTPQDSNVTNNESSSLGGKDRKKKNKKKRRTTRKKH